MARPRYSQAAAAQQATANARAQASAATAAARARAQSSAPKKGLLPGTPAPAQPSAPPPDPTYEAYRLSAGRNIQLGDAEATYQRAALSNEYGIGDTSNPYSKAALLQESYNRSKLGTTNSLGSQGQAYSGTMQNAQGENDRQYSISNDALQRAYSSAIHNVGVGQLQNYSTNAIGVSDESFNALLRQLGLA